MLRGSAIDQPSRVNYPGLNGLRALAMLVVFINHYNPRPTNHLVTFISIQGFCGVQIFFVLSGFLITGILWDTRTDPKRFYNFYGRRVLRIFPLYYATWVVLALLALPAGWSWDWHFGLYPCASWQLCHSLFRHCPASVCIQASTRNEPLV